LSFRTKCLPGPKLGFGQGEIREEEGRGRSSTPPGFLAFARNDKVVVSVKTAGAKIFIFYIFQKDALRKR
jgi:hypothetical protein